jgi:hypothetical protein
MQIMRLFLFVHIIFFYCACSQCRCIDTDAVPNFIGFDSTEVNTVIIKKFEKGTGFSKQLDSLYFEEGDFRLRKKGDTIYFPIRTGDFGVTARFDWKIILPLINREFQLTELTGEQTRGSCAGKIQCVNPITFVKINAIPFYFKEGPYQFYLKR